MCAEVPDKQLRLYSGLRVEALIDGDGELIDSAAKGSSESACLLSDDSVGVEGEFGAEDGGAVAVGGLLGLK